MVDTVRDAIADYLADEAQIVDPPTGALGYGTDISCVTDMDRNAREVSGSLVLAQALARRLDTPRGSLPDDPNYGIALRRMVNRPQTDAQIRSIAGKIYNELIKDDRIDSLSVKVTPSPTGGALAIQLIVTPSDVLESFEATLSVTDSAVLLEAIA